MAERKLWTKDELVLVFNLYLKLPFGKMHTPRTPEIIEMAIYWRTVSCNLPCINFAAMTLIIKTEE